MHNRGSRRRRVREGDLNVFDELMAENFPNLKKETDNQVEEAQRISNKMNPNKPTPRHTI